MFQKVRKQITPATVMAFVALVFALTGGAFAATGGSGSGNGWLARRESDRVGHVGSCRDGQGQEESRVYARPRRPQGRNRSHRSRRAGRTSGSHRSRGWNRTAGRPGH